MPNTQIRFAIAALGLACTILACGGHHGSSETQPADPPPKECEAFLASLQHCLTSLGPASIASARVAQTRASLDTQLARGPEAREAARRECAASLAHSTCR